MDTNHLEKVSPLLHGKITGTPLDAITTRLFFIFPLSRDAIKWLNTIIYRNDDFGIWINYWSYTHTLWGMLWGLAHYFLSQKLFSVRNFLIFHTLFEVWELWAGGYFYNSKLNSAEIIDIIFDTIFACIGLILMGKILKMN
jgi:hypothetical protein